MEKTKAVVLFSGGQDSTVCLFWAMYNFDEVYPLVINYGQKHVVDILCYKDYPDGRLGGQRRVLTPSYEHLEGWYTSEPRKPSLRFHS